MNNQVQQTENKAFVIGVLKEKKINFKLSSNNRQMAIGHLVLVCDTPLGKGEVKVKVMQFADKADGTSNSLYKGLQTVENEYLEGTTVKVEGSLEDGTYYSDKKGDFVEISQIKGIFINRVEETTPHCCKVGFEGFIKKCTPVNNELEVEIVGIGYQGVAVPVKAIIPENLVGVFQSKYPVGCTASLNIAILNVVTTKEIQQEIGFGEGLGETITTTIVKKIIFGGGNAKYQGTAGAITEETIKQGLALRQTSLDAKKEETIKKAENNNTSMQTGFGGAPQGFGGATNNGGFGMPSGGFGGFPQ